MRSKKKINIVLFALTGFGNTVLEALLGDSSVNVVSVFTVKYANPFPYYKERQLLELCEERKIPCYYGVKICSHEGLMLVSQYNPDLIIVATFKQILKKNVLSLPPLGVVNFHPSLLPNYRGPCATNAALLNDEKVTGVTIHYVTEELDAGNILLQRFISIGKEDNDGSLRQKLARLAGEMVPELIEMFGTFTKPTGSVQDHSLATFAPKPTVEDGYLERVRDIDTIKRKVKALNPLPGTSILVGDKRVAVGQFEHLEESGTNGLYDRNEAIDLFIESKGIRLYKKCD